MTDETNVVTDERLLLLIERIETLEGEKKGISDDIKDVYLEAKATGYDTKAMKHVIKERKKKRDDRLAEQAINETYEAAVGLV